MILKHNFHPWEGGEGKVPAQYVLARMELAKQPLQDRRYEEAVERSLPPSNIRSTSMKGSSRERRRITSIITWAAYEGLRLSEEAEACFLKASEGLDEPTSAMYYNDQPPHMIFIKARREAGPGE